MNFKFKFSDFFLGLATVAAIVLSVFLWIFIMTNDQHFSRIDQSKTNQLTTQQVQQTQGKSLFDLYLPTKSYGFKNGKPYRLYDAKKNFPFEFARDFRKGKITAIKLVGQQRTTYERLLNNDHFIQLSYPDQVTFNLLSKHGMKGGNREFNRIFVPHTNKWLYLTNDKNNHIYRLNIKGANFSRLRHSVKEANYKLAVRFVRLKEGYSAFYVKHNNWQIYSYLISHQSNSYFIARLLGTSGISSRTNKSGQVTYSLNYSTRLRVPKNGANNQHNYFYTHYEKNKNLNPTKLMLDSVYYVHQLGLMEQNLRFFEANSENISYTNYIEGIPIFLNDHDPQIDGNFSSEEVAINFNSLDFQIPVPFDGRERALPTTNQLVTLLNQHGLTENNIDKIIIGFKVEKDKSHSNLVNLIPTYYVKAYGTWKSASEWEKQDMAVYQGMNNGKGGTD